MISSIGFIFLNYINEVKGSDKQPHLINFVAFLSNHNLLIILFHFDTTNNLDTFIIRASM